MVVRGKSTLDKIQTLVLITGGKQRRSDLTSSSTELWVVSRHFQVKSVWDLNPFITKSFPRGFSTLLMEPSEDTERKKGFEEELRYRCSNPLTLNKTSRRLPAASGVNRSRFCIWNANDFRLIC